MVAKYISWKFFFFVFSLSGVRGQWPQCKETGADYGGFDYNTLYSYSPEECATWCESANANGGLCARWVFYEMGTMCSLKLGDITTDRRDASDPLTDADKAEFAPPGNLTTTTTASPAKADRITARLNELTYIHTAPSACVPGDISEYFFVLSTRLQLSRFPRTSVAS